MKLSETFQPRSARQVPTASRWTALDTPFFLTSSVESGDWSLSLLSQMAKVSKSVREKRKDFAKTKLKVGKSRQAPANQTDTSFRSKSVVLPKQSVTQESTVKEAQTLQHHIALLSHKSGETRKDALQQLISYLVANPPKASITVTPLMAALSPMIIDDTTSVRRVLLELFVKILANLPATTLNAHSNLLLLYISSAMSHISPSIRADSTRFLKWAMAYTNATQVIITNQLQKFMKLFSTLLGWNGQSSSIGSSKALSIHLDVFNTLISMSLMEPPVEVVPATEYIVPLRRDEDCFIPHRTTRILLQSRQPLNLFSIDFDLVNPDSTNYDIIEPYIGVILNFLSNKFTDSSNADGALCLPILVLLHTMILHEQVKTRKDLKMTTQTIAKSMDDLLEQNSRSAISGLVGEWRQVQAALP